MHNPTTLTDPTGLCSWYDVVCGAGALLGDIGQAAASAAPVLAPLVDIGAGVGCVLSDGIGCPVLLGLNTTIQEGLGGAG
jgi:hypothetical protein